jgi:predicted lipoprotein with Yx(FWY)xxD motif
MPPGKTLDSRVCLPDPSYPQRSEGSGFRVASDGTEQLNLEVLVKRILILAVLTVGLTPVAAATLLAAPAGASGVRAKIQLRQTSAGKILVNARGYTVYAYSRDSRDKDACQNVSHCLTAWPAVTTSGKPIAERGVRQSLLGTIKLKSGAEQITYAGHPLYTYIGDSMPAETSFINIYQLGGFWPAVNAAGGKVTKR